MENEASEQQNIKDHCKEVLSGVGATEEFCQFYADALQCEYDMTHVIYRMQKDLKDELGQKPFAPELIFNIVQNMSKRFYVFKKCVDVLSERGSSIPPLQFSPNIPSQPQVLKALCSLETREMNLHEGENLEIIDMSHPNRILVRNAKGDEGYVPTLCCILPTPDNNAATAIERLQVHLLTSWTECIRKMKSILFENLLPICKAQSSIWGESTPRFVDIRGKDRVSRRFKRIIDTASSSPSRSSSSNSHPVDLNKLHGALFSLEKELITLNSAELNDMTSSIANLDRAVLCYQHLHRQWRLFRHGLRDAPKPIRLVHQLEHLRQIAHGQNFKYYEVKMTLEDYNVVEHITYIVEPGVEAETGRSVLPGGSAATHETLANEQLVSTSLEERRRFVIRGVVDPRTGAQISMNEAVIQGVINAGEGMYVNPVTGERRSIQSAMAEQLIKVDYLAATRSVENKKAGRLVTIRTEIEKRIYDVTGAIDSRTAERLDAVEARKRGLFEDKGAAGGWYLLQTTGERMPLADAVDKGWMTATYERVEGSEVEVNTYLVSDVFDARTKKNVDFQDAVALGIFERETGQYLNKVTGERLDIIAAMKRGLIVAEVCSNPDNPSSSSLDNLVDLLIRRKEIRSHFADPLARSNQFPSIQYS